MRMSSLRHELEKKIEGSGKEKGGPGEAEEVKERGGEGQKGFPSPVPFCFNPGLAYLR